MLGIPLRPWVPILIGLVLTGTARAELPALSFCPMPAADIAPLADRPVYSVMDFGAKGDSASDDTQALQRAMDRVPGGSILQFPPGDYVTSAVLTLGRDDIILRGEQATLRAHTPDAQALILKGNRTAIIGMTLVGAARHRLLTLESAQLVVTGRWVQVLGNRISGAASAGIFVYGGEDFRIAGNQVFDTKADGIHMTNGARRGLVEHNLVFHTGDDMIAVVSYRPMQGQAAGPGQAEGLSGDILIDGNDVFGNSWGRGITVVGGENVAITHNRVRRIAGAAGILVAQEQSYQTYGDRNITIAHNRISEIEMSPLPSGEQYPAHGAIDINSSNEAPVEFITVAGNKVEGAGFSGIRLLGQACHIRLTNNRLNRLRNHSSGPAIEIIENPCPPSALQCSGNSADGRAIAADGQCFDSPSGDEGWQIAARSEPQGTPWASCVSQ